MTTATLTPTTGPPALAAARERAGDDVQTAVAAVAGAHVADIVATGSPVTLWKIAGSPWLTPGTAETLARDASDITLVELAANPVTPAHVLAQLASHSSADATVRYRATHNPSCPYDAVQAHAFTATAMLAHPDCPADRLADALHDPELCPAALAHPSTPWEAIVDVRRTLTLAEQVTLLRHPRMTQADAAPTLSALATHARLGDNAIAIWARHPNADPAWLAATAHEQRAQHSRGVSQDSAERILTAIARNCAASPDTLTLITDVRGDARTAALGNPRCPTDAMRRPLAHRQPPRWDTATGPARYEFSELAANPAATPDVLSRLGVADLPDLLTPPVGARRTIYDVARTHARTGQQARVILGLSGTWTLSLHELFDAAADITR